LSITERITCDAQAKKASRAFSIARLYSSEEIGELAHRRFWYWPVR